MFFKTLLSGEQLSSLPGASLTEETMELHPVEISSEGPVYWKEMGVMAHVLYWWKQKGDIETKVETMQIDVLTASPYPYMEEMDTTFTRELNFDYHTYCLVLRVRINL